MSIDQPLLRAASNVADLLIADDYASIEEHEIEPLARTLGKFLLDHGIAAVEQRRSAVRFRQDTPG